MEAFKLSKGSHTSLSRTGRPAPLPVVRAIEKLGGDIALARRRRRISQLSLAERIGSSLATVKRMESGDIRVPIHFIARALHVFGEIERVSQLLDTAEDAIGLALMDEQLPRRIRSRKPRPGEEAL
jgi:transcriptional regulator with XRE-family HTH domain